MHLYKLFLATALVYTGLVFAPLHVQAAESKSSAVYLEPVVVTAQKAEADKQDVPASISVFSAQQIEDTGSAKIADLARFVPNLSFSRVDAHATQFSFRGIGGVANMNKIWNTLIDGVAVPYVALDSLLDVEQIDFLPGSQGALYGRNTHAGAINITTKDPGSELNGTTSVEFERFNTARFKGAVGGPVNDVASYRLALGYNRSDGYIKNDFLDKKDTDDREQFTARGKIVFDNGDKNKLTFSMYADKYNAGYDSFGPVGKDASLHVENNTPGFNRGYLLSPTLTWEKEFNSFKLTSITNFSRSNYAFRQDWDFGPMDITDCEYDETYKTFSQELRLNGGEGTDLQWLFGLYGLRERIDSSTKIAFRSDAGAWMMMPGMFSRQNSTIDTTVGSAFGQIIYKLTPQLELTGAARIDYENKELDWRNADNSGFVQVGSVKKEKSWLSVSPSASVAWLFDDNKRIYASVAKGFKAGDFNYVMTEISLVQQTVDPEETLTYELGYKGRHFDNRLELNAALFHVTWDDMQVDVPTSSPYGNYEKLNAGKAHSTGFEVSARAILLEGWEAFVSGGYMFEYEFDEFKRSSTENFKGNKLPYTNNYNVSLGTTYRHGSGFFVGADASLQGKKYLAEDNSDKQGEYLLVNAKVGYEGENWDVYIYGRNLLDERYAVSAFNGARMAGAPLTVGMQAGIRF